jgi:hypothetical protein
MIEKSYISGLPLNFILVFKHCSLPPQNTSGKNLQEKNMRIHYRNVTIVLGSYPAVSASTRPAHLTYSKQREWSSPVSNHRKEQPEHFSFKQQYVCSPTHTALAEPLQDEHKQNTLNTPGPACTYPYTHTKILPQSL